uniref:Uncharacterized protein LOC111112086 isoform X2 n=1 Tax=Crassostrea virginica TaxID=6565 RepID=A0A8B8BQA7_CRAVI|nr:uncharacterized protein LOC111112086 isoform X2 [Crassostrea virginica]
MFQDTGGIMAVPITLSHIHHFLLQVLLSVILHNTTFVGCACLEDVLSLLDSVSSCEFKKEYFISKFIDDQQECLSNCSVSSTDPLYTTWSVTRNYELEHMEIKFSETLYRFEWRVGCTGYLSYPKVSLTFLCEGRHFYERGIGERCMNSSQCQAVNPGSTCNLSSGKCSCQEGYLWNSITCIEARKLGEPCGDPLQCSVINQNATCNDTTHVCECKEGYLEVINTCTKGPILLDEMCESYRQSEILDQEERDMKNIGSTLSVQIYIPSTESPRKDQLAIYVGVALAGMLLGILGCLAVMFIRNRHIMEAQNKHNENTSGNIYEGTLVQKVQVRKVYVYEELNSSNTLGKEKIDEPEDHGIYNQVNENAIELHVLSDDDYCLPHGANADVDSHVASGYDKVKDCPGDYGEVN